MSGIVEALELVRDNHRAVLVTRRSGGGVQTSPVLCGVDADGRIIISTRAVTAKARNLRRDPRATVCVLSDAFFGPWAQIDGIAELVEGPGAVDALVDYYRRVAGEHPDWDAYRRAMVDEGRILVRIRPDRAVVVSR